MRPVITAVRTIIAQPGAPCGGTTYAPAYYQEPAPVASGYQEIVLAQSDRIYTPNYPGDAPVFASYTTRNRGSDRIRAWGKRPGFNTWVPIEGGYGDGQNVVISNMYSFPWMPGVRRSIASSNGDLAATALDTLEQAEGYFDRHPDAFIGATASPAPFVWRGERSCLFTATVADPLVTTARQFALFWSRAVFDDWRRWDLVNCGRDHANVGARHALLWFGDFVPAGRGVTERGITSVRCLLADDYLYVWIEVWCDAAVAKNGLLRMHQRALYPGAPRDMEIWRSGDEWLPIVNGELPRWFTGDVWAGNPYQHTVSGVYAAHPWLSAQGERFMLTASGAGGPSFGRRGVGNCIEVAFSDDMTRWTAPQMVESQVAGFADGTGYDGQVRNPIWTGERFMCATQDAGVMRAEDPAAPHGVVYGERGCPNLDYEGLRIVELQVELQVELS